MIQMGDWQETEDGEEHRELASRGAHVSATHERVYPGHLHEKETKACS